MTGLYLKATERADSHLTQTVERVLEELIEEINKRLDEHHVGCLEDNFINGRFWEAKDTQQLLLAQLSLIKESNNKKS
jgi:hypothetical protein